MSVIRWQPWNSYHCQYTGKLNLTAGRVIWQPYLVMVSARKLLKTLNGKMRPWGEMSDDEYLTSIKRNLNIYSVQFSCSVVSDSLQPHKSQHTRPPCPSPSPRVHSNARPSSQWCHPAISSCVIPFSSCPQSLPASGSFPVSQRFAWGGQSTGVSALALFLPKNTQGWSPLEC